MTFHDTGGHAPAYALDRSAINRDLVSAAPANRPDETGSVADYIGNSGIVADHPDAAGAVAPPSSSTAAIAHAIHTRRALVDALDFGFALLDALDLGPMALDVIDDAIATMDAFDAPGEDLEDGCDAEHDTSDAEEDLGWAANASQLDLGFNTVDGDATALERFGLGFVRSGPDDAEDDDPSGSESREMDEPFWSIDFGCVLGTLLYTVGGHV